MRHSKIIFLVSVFLYSIVTYTVTYAQGTQTLEEFIKHNELQPYSPITSFKEKNADLRIVFGEKIEGPDLLQSWIFFDEQGNQTKLSYYNGSLENISSHTINEYDGQGNQIQNAYYRYDGSLGTLTKYTYNEQGNKLTEFRYSGYGALVSRIEFNYDNKGNLVEELFYGFADTLSSKTENKYDEHDNLIEELSYGLDDYLSSKIKNKYDDFGNLNESTYEYYPQEIKVVAAPTTVTDQTGLNTTAPTCTCVAVTTPQITPATATQVVPPTVLTGAQTAVVTNPQQFLAGAAPPTGPQVAEITKTKSIFDENGNQLQITRFTKLGDLVSENTYQYDKQNNQIKESFHRVDSDTKYSIERVFDKHGNRIESLNYNADGTLDYTITCSYTNFDKYNNWAKRTCIRYEEIFGEVQANYNSYPPEITIREIFYHTFVE